MTFSLNAIELSGILALMESFQKHNNDTSLAPSWVARPSARYILMDWVAWLSARLLLMNGSTDYRPDSYWWTGLQTIGPSPTDDWVATIGPTLIDEWIAGLSARHHWWLGRRTIYPSPIDDWVAGLSAHHPLMTWSPDYRPINHWWLGRQTIGPTPIDDSMGRRSIGSSPIDDWVAGLSARLLLITGLPDYRPNSYWRISCGMQPAHSQLRPWRSAMSESTGLHIAL